MNELGTLGMRVDGLAVPNDGGAGAARRFAERKNIKIFDGVGNS